MVVIVFRSWYDEAQADEGLVGGLVCVSSEAMDFYDCQSVAAMSIKPECWIIGE